MEVNHLPSILELTVDMCHQSGGRFTMIRAFESTGSTKHRDSFDMHMKMN